MAFWIIVAAAVVVVLLLGARSDLRRRRARRAGLAGPTGARNAHVTDPGVQPYTQMNHGVGDFHGR